MITLRSALHVHLTCAHDRNNGVCVFLVLHLVNDSSLRGGFMLNFLDDGQGMTSGNLHTTLVDVFSLVNDMMVM